MILHILGLCGAVMLGTALFLISLVKKSSGKPIVDSFIYLLNQSINRFNHRLFFIFLQFVVVSNIAIVLAFLIQKKALSLHYLVAFDIGVIIFSGIIYVLSNCLSNTISDIVNQSYQSTNKIVNKIILSGFFQILAFLGVFMIVLYVYLLFLDSYSLLALSIGLLIVAFYFRLAGGAYKAAAESNVENKKGRRVLTHPSEILVKSGKIIASYSGYYLDIISSWIISIAAFFVYLEITIQNISIYQLIKFPEVKWIIATIIFTSTSILCSIFFVMIRKKLSNIFLEIGYVIIGLTYIKMLIFTYITNPADFLISFYFTTIALVSMMGIAFFTNYLTSTNLYPIRFIAKQAQYGGANVLISSFFNGLIGNSIFTLVTLIFLLVMYNFLDVLGVLMMVTYALSIAVIVCLIKVFYIVSNQAIGVFESENDAILGSFSSSLKQISHTLASIGNSFCSAAGLLSSCSIIIPVLVFFRSNMSVDFLYGIGLGVIIMLAFYALVISGTYSTLIRSLEEISRQISDIPQIEEENKSHPNIIALSDSHAINGINSVTLSASWIFLSLILTYFFISINGIYGALLGIFLTVFIQSFFWSIFGDSVSSVYQLMKDGLYGGNQTPVFQQIFQAYLYAHYFQWVLAPTGIIIMKLVGMISFLLLIF